MAVYGHETAIAPATNGPGMECAIFGDLTIRRVMVALKELGRRWVEVDGKHEQGRARTQGKGATHPGTDMAERERDGACYKRAVGGARGSGARVRVRKDGAEEAIFGAL